MDYDIIIIGAGPGGYETAAEAASRYGMKTALIEKRELGGTCLNRGCIPTKTFLHTAELYDEIKLKGELLGFTGNTDIAVDMSHLQERKNEVVADLRAGVSRILKVSKVDVFDGTGSIADKSKVIVKNGDDVNELTGRHIVIATGSKPDRQEDLPGTDLPGVVTSDEILDLDRVPESLAILGGGVIGMELASVFNALGSRVSVLKASSKIFNNMDAELGKSLKMLMKKRGVEIKSGLSIKRIEKTDRGVACVYSTGDDETIEREEAEMILLAKGRLAQTAGLIEDNASEAVKALELDARGRIMVDEHFCTNVEGIYAIGDCISGDNLTSHAQLAHVATAEGRALLAYINNENPCTDLNAVPSCIYTSPEIASVGADPDKCKEEGRAVSVKKYPMGANGKSVLTAQERGFIKVIAEEETGRVIGASMMCARATDMISVFTEAIVNGLTLEEMQKVMFPHPTFCEGIGEAVRR